MKAYWYDNLDGDQRLAHDSGKVVTIDELKKLGVFYHRIPDLDGVNQLASERGYRNRDEIVVSPEKMGDVYEDKVKSFFHEHLHEDEEIRFVRDGHGYFDVRDVDDAWIRIHVEKVDDRISNTCSRPTNYGQDDLIILPAGIYHRFTTDESNYIKAMRLFKDEPKWTPLNRTTDLDVNPHRKEYVQQYLESEISA
ncbi:putative 1,2-dihydroxy-3-keto-5-methylthiopentene dioxygenase [Colletotrichum tanaceti]|uniref:Acireductone dioxygenase n=1 Tax=Colletotrichum tanaceti TaxID=1306861 RepID=A0A4U6XUU5_9PEZI|nr:putative 1,2-dihydroxy-3-keto-5-methylthiopentene dioxygenase [Colletotrichum tanaceti]TKW59609.1 putative 1,2-dihydroxy-3-keto-5-methylthiopentene dioxygenase [Colletotrichum tanaceti]